MADSKLIEEHLQELEASGHRVQEMLSVLGRVEGFGDELLEAGLKFMDKSREHGHAVTGRVLGLLPDLSRLGAKAVAAFLEMAANSLSAGSAAAKAASRSAGLFASMEAGEAVQVAGMLARIAELDSEHGTKGFVRFLADSDGAGTESMIEALKALPSLYEKDPDLGEAGAACLARAASKAGPAEVKLCSDALGLEPKHDKDLMPDLAMSLSDGVQALPREMIGPYVKIVASVARSSAGSAEHLAYKLPRIISRLRKDDLAASYLNLAAEVVDSLGLAAVSFCTSRLPALMTSNGPTAAAEKVGSAVALAASHGKWAGLSLLLGKTKAAKTFMMK